jgi:rare lipoprotein A
MLRCAAMRQVTLLPFLTLLGLAACTTSPPARLPASAEPLEPQAAQSIAPPDLLKVPDAVPRVEPIRLGGPNKPYEVFGQRFEPVAHDRPFSERGMASWYGKKFHGRSTASGEIYNMYAMTAAHPRMPLPSYVRVRNPANGKEVIVRVNDRGPFVKGRIIDLSYTAALKLDLHHGVAPVEIERITFEEIRTGRWQGAQPEPLVAPAQAADEPATPSTQDLRPVADAGADVRVASKGFWLQLAAFRQLSGAETLLTELGGRFPDMATKLTVYRDRGVHRVQLGPLSDRDVAGRIAQRLREEVELQPLLVQR